MGYSPHPVAVFGTSTYCSYDEQRPKLLRVPLGTTYPSL